MKRAAKERAKEEKRQQDELKAYTSLMVEDEMTSNKFVHSLSRVSLSPLSLASLSLSQFHLHHTVKWISRSMALMRSRHGQSYEEFEDDFM